MKRSTALKTLGLSEGATEEDIKKAHRKLIIENHPDKFGQDAQTRAKAEEKTKLINEARDVLLNHTWEPEYGTAGTSYGAPFSYDPFAAARTGQAGNPQASNGANPFAGWPFSESFVWTVWDSSGNQHTYRGTQSGTNPFEGFNPYQTNPFKEGANPFVSFTVNSNPFQSDAGSGSHTTAQKSSGQPNRSAQNSPFSNAFFSFADFFMRPPTNEELLKQAKTDLLMDIKLIVAKVIILGLALLLSAPATGLYLYTIISIGQGIWKRLNFLSLIFLIPFVMLAIIFVPNGNAAVGIFAFILFVCSVAFDIANVWRHTKRIRHIKKNL